LAQLKAAVLGDVITKNDIYQNSSPEEHAAFLRLLEEGPDSKFDVVIDGLNVALVRTPGLGAKVKPIG
jgi:hypothetical protein